MTGGPSRFSGKTAALLVLVALLPSAYLAWQSRDIPHLGYFQDDALYFVAAKSLAAGTGYRIASLPDTPYQTKYPPLYPLMLSLVWRADGQFPGNLPWAALLAWIMVPLYVLVAWIAFRDLGFEVRHAWLLSASIAVNPSITPFCISLLSEMPFTVLLIAATALTERARKGSKWWASGAGLTAGLACLTRTAGLPLFATGCLILLISRRKWHALIYTGTVIPFAAVWQAWTHFHRVPHATEPLLYYTDYIAFYLRDGISLPLLFWTNFDVLTRSIGSIWLPSIGESNLQKSIVRVLALIAVAGVVRLVRRRGLTAYTAFAAAYIVMVLAWNFMPDHRFLLPLLPLVVAGFATELPRIARALYISWTKPGLADRVLAAAIAVALAAVAVFAVREHVRSYTTVVPRFVAQHRSALAERQNTYRWISTHTPSDSRFAVDLDPVLYLHTGRLAQRLVVPPSLFYEHRELELPGLYASLPEYARKHRLTHILTTTTDWVGDLPARDRRVIQQSFNEDPRLVRVYTSATASIYQLTTR